MSDCYFPNPVSQKNDGELAFISKIRVKKVAGLIRPDLTSSFWAPGRFPEWLLSGGETLRFMMSLRRGMRDRSELKASAGNISLYKIYIPSP